MRDAACGLLWATRTLATRTASKTPRIVGRREDEDAAGLRTPRHLAIIDDHRDDEARGA